MRKFEANSCVINDNLLKTTPTTSTRTVTATKTRTKTKTSTRMITLSLCEK